MTNHLTHHEAIEFSNLDAILEDYRKKQEDIKFSMLLIPVYIRGQENEFTVRIDFLPEKIIPDVQVKSLQGSLAPAQVIMIQRKVEDIFAPRFFKVEVTNDEIDDEYGNMLPPTRSDSLKWERNQKIKDAVIGAGKRILAGTLIAGLMLFGLHLVGLHLLGFHVFRAAHVVAEALLGLSAIGLGTWVYDKVCRGNDSQEKTVTEEVVTNHKTAIPVKTSDSEGGSGASFSFKSFIQKGKVSTSGPDKLSEVTPPKASVSPG